MRTLITADARGSGEETTEDREPKREPQRRHKIDLPQYLSTPNKATLELIPHSWPDPIVASRTANCIISSAGRRRRQPTHTDAAPTHFHPADAKRLKANWNRLAAFIIEPLSPPFMSSCLTLSFIPFLFPEENKRKK